MNALKINNIDRRSKNHSPENNVIYLKNALINNAKENWVKKDKIILEDNNSRKLAIMDKKKIALKAKLERIRRNPLLMIIVLKKKNVKTAICLKVRKNGNTKIVMFVLLQ